MRNATRNRGGGRASANRSLFRCSVLRDINRGFPVPGALLVQLALPFLFFLLLLRQFLLAFFETVISFCQSSSLRHLSFIMKEQQPVIGADQWRRSL